MQREATWWLLAHVHCPTMILGAWPATSKFKSNVLYTFSTEREKNTDERKTHPF